MKGNKMKRKSTLAILGLVIISCFFNPVFAEDTTHTIEGSIRYSGKGDIYIYLVNEDIFSTPLVGLQTIVLKVEAAESQKMIKSFRFEAVKSGIYGIRCFQDTNGNGKLDRGLFGPKEPWGMSWNAEKPSKWPRFANVSFSVYSRIKLQPIDVD